MQVSITTEDGREVNIKGVGRKLIEKLYQTHSSVLQLSDKIFAYDGEKTLYTVGPLPQNKFDFTVVLEESFSNKYVTLLFFFPLWYLSFSTLVFSLCDRETGSPGSSSWSGKRSKRSFRSKTYMAELSYAAKIPLKSIALALKGADTDNSSQDALRVLDTILRQKAANMYLYISFLFIFLIMK